MLLVGPNGQGDKLTIKSYELKMEIPPNYKQNPTLGQQAHYWEKCDLLLQCRNLRNLRRFVDRREVLLAANFCSFRAAKTKKTPGGTLPQAKRSRPAKV
jgi:hypothetical protein